MLPDIERVAITLLQESRPRDPQLAAYVRRLVEDPDYCEMPERGWWKPLIEDEPEHHYPDAQGQIIADFWHQRDLAVAYLAHRLAQYRQMGRPEGDVRQPLDRAHGIEVVTSLAAQVVEYHRAVTGAWAERLWWETHPEERS